MAKGTLKISGADSLLASDLAPNSVDTSELVAGAVTGAKIAYLGDGAGNLTGTISSQQLHLADTFTLTGDLTVNDDLILGKARDDGTGQTLTHTASTARILSGTGTLTMGSSIEGGEKDRAVTGASIPEGAITSSKLEQNVTIAGDFIPSTPLSHRNMIINGGMQVWQRATAATLADVGEYCTADRWAQHENSGGTFTSEKHTMSLAELSTTGHADAMKLLVASTDTSIAAGDNCRLTTNLEAQTMQHMRYGTANAKTVTISFWVKSNLTGTYCLNLYKSDSTNYSYVKEYSISAADTWEKKEITITPTAGSTSFMTSAAGIINNDNGQGMQISFGLMWGSNFTGATDDTWSSNTSHFATTNQVNWMGASNNFYITGVQLELGSNATPFEHRSYGDELHRCKRYYQFFGDATYQYFMGGIGNGVSQAITTIECNPVMRDTPSPSVRTGTSFFGTFNDYDSTSSFTVLPAVYALSGYITSHLYAIWTTTGGSDNRVASVSCRNLALSSEL